MKRINKIYFDAVGLNGIGLNLSPDETNTPEAVKKAIDRCNNDHRKNDYQVEQFNIYRITFHRTFGNDGQLLTESEFRTRIEVYPPEPDPTPRYTVIKENTQIPRKMSSYDVSKAVRVCENYPGSYVVNNAGKIVYRCSKDG